MRIKTLTLAATLLLAGATVSACDSSKADSVSVTPRQPVERTVPAGPEDRDAAAVDAATAALAPCSLLPELSGVRSGRRLGSTHSCRLETEKDVRVTAYQPFDADARWDAERFDLNGVVAYRDSPLKEHCSVWLPVSQTHAIEFFGEADGDAPDLGDDGQPYTPEQAKKIVQQHDCSTIEAYAEAAAAKLLQDPASLTRPEGPSRLTACAIMTTAFGPAEDNDATRRPDSGRTGQSRCAWWSAAQETDPTVTLEITVGTDLAQWLREGGWDAKAVDLAGTKAYVTRWQDDPECVAHFDYGRYDGPTTRGDRLIARVASPCTSWRADTTKVIEAIGATRPGDLTQDPLVYAWNEQDVPGVGACVDVRSIDGAECAPSREVDVPVDPADLIAQGEVEPDVLCSASAALVKEHFGAELVPTTVDTDSSAADNGPKFDCLWVKPDHSMMIRLNASTLPMVAPTDAEIAGHPASVKQEREWDVYRAEIALADERDPGALTVQISTYPPRGWGQYRQAPRDLEPLEQAPAFVEALTKELLGVRKSPS